MRAFASKGKITVAWNHVWEPTLAYYKVYISLQPNGPYSYHASVPRDVHHYDYQGTNGTTYYFKISAVFNPPLTESPLSAATAAKYSAAAPGPLKVTIQGRRVLVNGAVFTAKGIKSTFYDPPTLAAQGFNVFYASFSPNIEAGTAVDAMNRAQSVGLRVILQVEADLYPRIYDATGQVPAVSVPQAVRLKRALAGLANVKDHPALLGYVIADEPEDQLHIEPDFDSFLINARNQIKTVDPNHPLLLDVSDVTALDRFSAATDIILLHHHVYVPTGDPPTAWDAEYAASIRQTAPLAQSAYARVPNKPFWASSFSYGNYKSATFSTPRPPTPDEYTSIFYQWLVGGATGVIAYTYRMADTWLLPSGDLLPMDKQLYPGARRGSPELWAKMRVLNQEHEMLRIVLALPVASSKITIPTPQSDSVKTAVKQGNNLYVLAVNTSPNALGKVPMTVSATGNYSVRVLFENRTLRADNSRWADDFAPYARHVYELTKVP